MSIENKNKAYNKLWLISFYLNRARELMESMTEEMIEASPHYVKYVLPNMIADAKRDGDWFDSMAGMMKAVFEANEKQTN